MIAVILAAGTSKRLRPLTDTSPKCLLPLQQGENLLSRYLTLLQQEGITKTIVVTGFNAAAVKEEVKKHRGCMEVVCIENTCYETTHPLDSFLLTEQLATEDFLLLNSDLFFTKKILSVLIECSGSAVAVDSSAVYVANEMFVNYTVDGIVTEISNRITRRVQGQGKSVQIVKLCKNEAVHVFARARSLAGKDGMFYPAQAFGILIEQQRFKAVDVAGEFSFEIDTVADYEALLEELKHNREGLYC